MWSLREPWTKTADPHMAELPGAIYAWMARQESARRSVRVRAAGLPVGRQPEAKDRRQRKRSGYVAAWEPGGKRRERSMAS